MSKLIPATVQEPDSDPTKWYKPGRDIQEFHSCPARIRALIGGRGTGKTTGICVEAVAKHGWHNAGAKIYILRKTQESNEDTTLETFNLCWPKLGTAYQDTGVSLFKKVEGGKEFRIPSRVAAEKWSLWQKANPNATKQEKLNWLDNVGARFCSYIIFAGVPEARYRGTRFRGFECSLLIFVEADQLDKEDLDLGVACLRWKGADPSTCDANGFILDTGVILDTNPPGTLHWIAEMEKDLEKHPNSDIKFWHLKTRDNAHNLPSGYVETLEHQYRKNPAMYARMLNGEYADAFDGNPVLYAFTQEHAKLSLPWPSGAYLIRSWDFGTTNCVIWSAYWTDGTDEYWWDLQEYYAIMSDVNRQCKAALEITNQVFPFWNDRLVCSGVRDYCDVAGKAEKDTGSSVRVLHSYQIFPGYAKIGLQESLAVYNRILEKTDRFGKLIYNIDKKCCPMLWTASSGGYRYPVQGEPGFGGDEPLKGPRGGNYDHLADASRYGKYNCMRLTRVEVEKMKNPVGHWGRKETPNRPRPMY
jgi:hypothetical protein